MRAVFLGAALILAGAGCADRAQISVTETPAAGSPAADLPAVREITLEEIAGHSTPGDCWTVIGGKVYDLSDYASGHPGGAAVDQGCGQDATELFETRPMGSGTPHSDKARSFLPKYEIGAFKP